MLLSPSNPVSTAYMFTLHKLKAHYHQRTLFFEHVSSLHNMYMVLCSSVVFI